MRYFITMLAMLCFTACKKEDTSDPNSTGGSPADKFVCFYYYEGNCGAESGTNVLEECAAPGTYTTAEIAARLSGRPTPTACNYASASADSCDECKARFDGTPH